MMRFIVRELAGWFLMGLGLFVFYECFVMLMNPVTPGLLQSAPLVVIGVILFRGGLHLLKVAVAARLSLRAQDVAATAARDRRPGAR
jgi:hypothetical protein